MTRVTLSLMAPPLAVCRYGCASCCAAPIGVFWLTGIVSLIYGGLGGPLRSGSVAWWVVALGCFLWATATAWALLTIQSVADQRECEQHKGICRVLPEGGPDDSDPLEEIGRLRDRD